MRSAKILFIILSTLFIAQSVVSQVVNYKNYTVDHGLPSSEIYQVIQDQKGFIWFATDQGVSRFDGYKFKNYSIIEGLPDNTILEIFEDSKARLWFVSISGKLSWFENDSIYEYPYNDSIIKHLGGSDYPIKKSFYVDNQDNVYIGFYHHHLFHITPEGSISKIIPPNGENMAWLTANENILYTSKYKINDYLLDVQCNDGFETYTLPKSKTANRSFALLYKGELLYSDFNNLYRLNSSTGLHTEQFDTDILWMSQSNDGLLWVGFLKKGVKAFKNFDFSHNVFHLLEGHSVSSVFTDSEGGMWITTLENGCYYFPDIQVNYITKEQGLQSKTVNKLAVKDEKVYFGGTNSEYYEFDLHTLKKHYYHTNEEQKSNRLIKWIGDTLIVGNNIGGSHFIYKDKVFSNSDYCYNSVLRINNYGILGGYTDKIRVHTKNGHRKLVSLKNVKKIYDLIRYNDTVLWIGTNAGLYEFNILRKTYKKINWHKALGSRINILLKQDETVWIGTKGAGLLKVERNSLKQYTKADGLPGNSIDGITIEDSLVWLGTNKGVARMTFDIKDSISDIVFLNKGHGLPTSEIEDIAIAENKLFAATKKGLAILDKNITTYYSPVYITGVSIAGNDTLIKKQYELKHDQNYIEISFVGLNYQRFSPLKYKYMLHGIDTDWNTTEDLSVRYAMLLPGEYTFKVKCINSYGKETISNNQITFRIKKPYYQTTSFLISVILAGLLLLFIIVFSIIRIKIRELKKRNNIEKELNSYRQRALSAQMNPHFIYNSLNSVQNYILKNDRIKSNEYLARFGHLMRRILQNSQNSSISLQEELDALKHYVDMELIRFNDSFRFTLFIDENINIEALKVPPLIIQPFVENAIHHGLRIKEGDKHLKVSVFEKTEIFCVCIEDNGIGRQKSYEFKQSRKQYKSYGTEITNKRLDLYRDLYKNDIDLTIIDLEEDGGTRVEIKFKKTLGSK
ncbi:Sensor histidine kinase YpdA [Salinivirga cyanobacteriivorans]|uniref:Sensor histidine kinase YpdA n=1 Tax=Salinivirga cyanobacteriivorans TaxID=1307839 RepID=A0A0S2I4R6_9BACT|nr:histidine kinase [Salinivirga cyanobacteriivorans]ALO17416.1 Sensor histidine kinase YpdA [Salinivirga cyanobacteriivorans]